MSNLEKLRAQNLELTNSISNIQSELLVLKTQNEAMKKQKEKMIHQHRDLIQLLDKEKKEKNQLLFKLNQQSYNQTKESIEAKRYESLLKNLSQENQRLQNEFQTLLQSQTKETQELKNKLVLSQAKADKYQQLNSVVLALSKSSTLIQEQNRELKKKIEIMTKEDKNKSFPFQKTIIKYDDNSKKELIHQFENKLAEKEHFFAKKQIQYERQIAELKLRLAQLSANISK